ncbi:MAG: hypothetical protein M3350_05935 [Actinomycetota bacterium]|nr:hypothetical protein [Actinomycetota bacterium]MDQ3720305.1 hypothetical protein [Actinomycetota bacterium]
MFLVQRVPGQRPYDRAHSLFSDRDDEDDYESLRPTTVDWLASARNYVEFANQAGRYDEVAKFLRSKEARRLKDFED